MQAITKPNIESEISYAYLYAVASKCGISCRDSTRHEDGNGIDAHLTAWPSSGRYQEVDLKIQLKATVASPTETATHYSYFLKGINRYNDLRKEDLATPRILVVLFLPGNSDDWLVHDESRMSLHRCAYWVSLCGAPESSNKNGETVYLPKTQHFSPGALSSVVAGLANRVFPRYVKP